MRIKVLTLILGLFAFVVSFGQSKSEGIAATIKLTTFKEKLEKDKDAVLIDVRTPSEWKSGIIPTARKINFYDEHFEEKVNRLDKSKTIYVYCKSGGRSKRTMNKMRSLGFKEIYNLSGGITAWKAAGYEVN